ncbi:hypothetical protein [Streptomyces lasiicapitis]|uniref:Uncharacterized protein n=1 Tax=Streptomyces lasiicapitis TaxID=1923961 RepID=A0ABQ2MVN4_9ACTN|nr:hypothetical protein [Streptomyces lasiicapitis]GGO59656.1 hypothetical protein GCM10012286_81770 [Streptomyces lasiicapitis]
MWSRARLAWCSLVGVLVVVLGVGVLCGSAAARVAGVQVADAAGTRAVGSVEASVAADGGGFFVQAADAPGVPGCGKGGQDGDGQRPAAPPRSPTSYELLPALYDTRAASGCSWIADQAVLTLSPGRAPPALVPPSPIDLSVLRV